MSEYSEYPREYSECCIPFLWGPAGGGEYSSTPCVALTPSLVRACRRIFAVFDANGDGLLDFDELMRVSTRRVPCEYPVSTPVSTL